MGGIYIEFANKLLAFANDRKPLVEIIKSVYEQIDINLPKLEKDGAVFDIDPFTLFGLFNMKLCNGSLHKWDNSRI